MVRRQKNRVSDKQEKGVKVKDLNKLLKNVVSEFGKNELYDIPTISWSEENMLSRFGEYQYWKNHIIISCYLNSDEVTDRAVESVIYHEYMHQVYREHTKEFESHMKRFAGYDDYYEEVNRYFNEISGWCKEYKHNLPLEADRRTVFCRLPFYKENFESYLDDVMYYNHMMIGVLPEDIAEKYCEEPIEQVIWTVNYEGQEYIAGWAKGVKLYSTIKVADLEQYEMGRYEYQYKYLQKNGKWLLSCNLLKCFDTYEIPDTLDKQGICESEDVDKNIYSEIINMINNYASDFTELGVNDDAMYDIPAINIDNIDVLMKMAEQELYSNRCVWIMNKAVEVEKSIETYYWRGRAMESVALFKEASLDYQRALGIEPSNEEIKYSTKIMEEAIKAIPCNKI